MSGTDEAARAIKLALNGRVSPDEGKAKVNKDYIYIMERKY